MQCTCGCKTEAVYVCCGIEVDYRTDERLVYNEPCCQMLKEYLRECSAELGLPFDCRDMEGEAWAIENLYQSQT